MARSLKILLASSEVHPYAKTGGLADVSAALPRALKELGHDVRVIMPKYKSVARCPLGLQSCRTDIQIAIGKRRQRGFLFRGELPGGVPIYFVENDSYFGRDELYGDARGDYPDNAERFIFFSQAVLEAAKALRFQPDIVHCNDWQTGLVAVYLKTLYAQDPWFQNTRSVFSIHNLGYQGNFSPSTLGLARLPRRLYSPEGLEFYGHFSFLKSGILFADLLTTVSQTYCKEIQTQEMGFRMDGVLRKRSADLHGVLNGIDYREWNPAADPWIKNRYSSRNLRGKKACKEDLRQRFRLAGNSKRPLLCMITRLSRQKGIDLIEEGLESLLQAGADFVLLGTGDPRHEKFFKNMRKRFPERCGTFIGFDEKLAHQILAGSDLLLMPSYYEPCGLTQMYALKYGTVPLVRSVGGLQDTVKKYNPKTQTGTGFKFKKNKFNYLLQELGRALSLYKSKSRWRRLMLNGMQMDYGWDRAAAQYLRLYNKALKR